MKFDKLQALIGLLTDEVLDDFVVSPLSSFETSRPQVKKLFSYLRLHKSSEHTDEELSAGTQIEAKRLSDLANKLLDVLEQYLVSRRMHRVEGDIEQDIALLDVYSDMRLWKNYLFVEKRLEKRLNRNEALYPQDFMLLYNYYTKVKVNEKSRIGRKDHGGFERITYYLGALYAYENLKYQIEALFRKKIIGTDIKLDRIAVEALFTVSEKYRSITSIRMMTLILKLIVDDYKNITLRYDEIKGFFELIADIKKPQNIELKNLAVFLLNICIEAMNRGYENFATEYILVIDFLSNRNLLFEKEELITSRLKNIMTVSRKAKKQEWAMDFLLKHIDTVNPKLVRKVLVAYYQSLFALDAGDVETAYEAFPGKEYETLQDVYLLLSIKKLWIQVLVETKQFDIAEHSVRSLLRFVKDSKINERHKGKYNAFAKNTQKLWRNKTVCNFNLENLDVADLEWLNKVHGYALALNNDKSKQHFRQT